MLSVTEILSVSTAKILVEEQIRFPEREERVSRCNFHQNYKLQVFIVKLRVANYDLNLELQFSKWFA